MTHIDWSLDAGGATPLPAAGYTTVLAALRRRRNGDVDSWLHAAVLALIVAFGSVIALAGTASNRLVLAAVVPAVIAPAAAWCRRRRTAGRLHAGVLAGDRDALAETARFLDRPAEIDARVSALRLAATCTDDAFESALYTLEATDAGAHGRPPVRTTRAQDLAVTAYCLTLGIVVAGTWMIELRS